MANPGGDGDATHLTFLNRTDDEVQALWVNHTGSEVLYHELQPGAIVLQSTYYNHYWRFRTVSNGKLLGTYQGKPAVLELLACGVRPRLPTDATRSYIKERTREAWGRLGPDEQRVFHEEWREMDEDGSGSVTKSELQNYITRKVNEQASASDIQGLFDLVDSDGNGTLDFYEAGALLLLLAEQPYICDCCNELLRDGAAVYTCPTCWVKNLPSGATGKPTIMPMFCAQCYSTAHPTRPLHNHPLRITQSQLGVPLDEWEFSKELPRTCACCCTSHTDVPGYMGEAHLVRRPDGTYLCEWCTNWICRRCGSTGVDVEGPCVDAWAGSWKCRPCKGKSTGSEWSFTRSKIMDKAKNTSRSHCQACRDRALSGRLTTSTGGSSSGGSSSSSSSNIREGVEAFKTGYEIGQIAVTVASSCAIM